MIWKSSLKIPFWKMNVKQGTRKGRPDNFCSYFAYKSRIYMVYHLRYYVWNEGPCNVG